MFRRHSMVLIVTGVAGQLIGFALDSVLHSRDATLASREGVLTLSNPGHALFAVSLALTVSGLALLLLEPVIQQRRRLSGGRFVVAALPGALVLLLAGGAFAVAAGTGGFSGHPHDEAMVTGDDHHAHTAEQHAEAVADHHPAAGVTAAAPAGSFDPSRHEHGPEVNVSWEQLRETDRILTTARAATEKYRDVAVARADGYRQVTHVVPGLGAHFVQPLLLAAGAFDAERPPILLYDRTADGGFELTGISWSLPKQAGDSTPPAPRFGPLATWHYHTDLCFAARAGGPVVSASDAATCRAGGGAFVKETGWMIHAWLFRDSPEGVFSHQNSTIVGIRPAVSR